MSEMQDKITKSSLVILRPMQYEDLPFVFSSWLKGLRWGNNFYLSIDQDSYFKGQHSVIERILANKNTTVTIACLADAPEVLVGYAAYTGGVLHFAYVKEDWRGIGLARDMVPKDIKSVSNFTRVGLSILRKHPGVIINPYKEI